MCARTAYVCGLFLCVCSISPAADREPTRQEVNAALDQAVSFFREQVSTEGGYLWQYSADLQQREGEGRATDTQVWVQSPGTPRVGQALLDAYRRTGEQYLLDAAVAAADCLVRGQLQSGGWDYRIEFDAQRRMRYAYRVPPGSEDGRNTTTLDDDNTQSALRFLMQMDQELRFENAAIHECVDYALKHLLSVQYPNGAWPQRFDSMPNAEDFPVRRATYPESWSRVHTKPDYTSYYTFNDNTLADMIRTMLEASRVYGEPHCQAAAEKAGDFIILAQMPDPQPAWAQQYDAQMHPSWARKFEPPAITGGESQGVLRVLMELYEATGKRKFLVPIPRAIQYLKRSLLPDGRLARFYALRTNEPLYFTRDYQLTDSPDDLPTHYAFVVSSQLDSLERRFSQLSKEDWKPLVSGQISTQPLRGSRRAQQVRDLIGQLDARGAWVESGQLKHADAPHTGTIICCSTFIRNVKLLSEYIGREQEEADDVQ